MAGATPATYRPPPCPIGELTLPEQRLLSSGAITAVLLAAVVAAAVGYAQATHRVFSATADEPLHIAAGLEWLQGNYRPAAGAGATDAAAVPPARVAVVVDPPLARVATALGPHAAGLRTEGAGLRQLLYAGAGSDVNLTSARRGVLPFLALLILLTWAIARHLFGKLLGWPVGIAAAAAVASVPVVIGHGGLATTDVAFAAMFLLAMLAFLAWLDRAPSENPSWSRTALFGITLGLALATKLSSLLLLPGMIAIAFVRQRERDRRPRSLATALLPSRYVALAAGLAALVVWAAYRFSVGRPSEAVGQPLFAALTSRCLPPGVLRDVAVWALGLPVPAPELLDGLLVLCSQNAPGQTTSFLLGQISQQGFALFYPIALAVKTPLPFLVLVALGIGACARRRDLPAWRQASRWRVFAPLLMAAATLLLVLPARTNVGVRHVLHLYPLLAIYAGAGAVALWQAARRQLLARAATVSLGVWLLATPLIAAPDHTAWFNALAGRHPENVLLDSDLDWGQDLLRLEKALADRRVDRLSLAYFGGADPCRHHLPPGRWLRPHERTSGWIAISEMYRKGVVGFYYRNGDYCDPAQLVREAAPDPNQYAWLDAYQPVERVGKSIRLYQIP